MIIKLTKHQAAAFATDMAEIKQLQASLNARMATYGRYAGVVLLDAGGNPADCASYELKQVGDDTVMVCAGKE